jgi:hypothetical protein
VQTFHNSSEKENIMNTRLRTVVSIVALGLFAGGSGSALAGSLETQYSIYDRSAQATRMQVQAGSAGPSHVPGLQVVSAWPTESQFSVYHLASVRNDAPAAQAGRAGPVSIGGSFSGGGVSEAMYSIYDLSGRL